MSSMVQNNSSYFTIVNPKYKLPVYTAAAATGLAIGAVLAPWESIRIIGLTILTGVSYKIANDMIAYRDCIEYFTVGHKYDGTELRKRPLKTLNPSLNAIAWGIATWPAWGIAGSFWALISRMPFPGLSVKITTSQLTPYLLSGAAITVVAAHILSRSAQKKMAEKPQLKYPEVPLDFQARWEACNVRNLTGSNVIKIGGIALSVTILVARIGLITL